MFKHFVITRFNVVYNLNVFRKDKQGNSTQTDEWLAARFDLFEKFCFPSVINQTNLNFYWLVLFSINTDEKYKKRIAAYSYTFKNFVPVYLNDGEDEEWEVNLDKVRAEISKYLESSDHYVITSRIDNDDAFHKNMIQFVQNEFAGQDDLFLSFDEGLQYDMEHKLLSRIVFPGNAFISRIEKIYGSGFKTVFASTHTRIQQIAKVKYIRIYPLWLQLIHTGNIHNAFKTKRMLISSKSIKDFNVLAPINISIPNCFRFTIRKLGRHFGLLSPK